MTKERTLKNGNYVATETNTDIYENYHLEDIHETKKLQATYDCFQV